MAGTAVAGVRNATRSYAGAPALITQGSDSERVALGYAGLGWLVFPAVGKRPHPRFAPHGLNSASADPDLIRSWYRAEPAADVAIACRPSGLLVFDVDDRHGGADRLHELERDLGRLPDTPRALTGDGFHVYAQNPRMRTVNRIGPGIDVRDCAYVIAPPSRHASGRRYEWEIDPAEGPVAQLPSAWLDRLARRASNCLYREPGPIPRGRRNDTLTRRAGAMRRARFDADAIEAALAVDNRAHCKPPLSQTEVRKIGRSIGKREVAPPWALDPLAFVNDRVADLTAYERLVLVALCHRADDEGKVIGGTWIQNETGLSKSSVIRVIKSLEAKGCVNVQRSQNRPNRYSLRESARVLARPAASHTGTQSGSSGVRETPTAMSTAA
jgi:DNA-binding MarR family transcriptional regulator